MKPFHAFPFLSSLSLALSDHTTLVKDNALLFHARDGSSSNTTSCATLHMIVARASQESPGEGIIGAVATQVQSLIPGSDSEAVVYPATLANYVASESAGITGMQHLIASYEARCPNSKIALLGYSQGAQVVGDVLCGTSETYWNSTPPESAATSKNIIASIQMGDPTFALNQPQDVGNATKGGIFQRNHTAGCPSSIMKSYCNFNDTFCDSGSSLTVHESYVGVYGDPAVQWIVGKFATVNGTSTTSGSGTGSTSPTSSVANPISTLSSSGDGRFGGSSLNGVLALIVTSFLYVGL